MGRGGTRPYHVVGTRSTASLTSPDHPANPSGIERQIPSALPVPCAGPGHSRDAKERMGRGGTRPYRVVGTRSTASLTSPDHPANPSGIERQIPSALDRKSVV